MTKIFLFTMLKVAGAFLGYVLCADGVSKMLEYPHAEWLEIAANLFLAPLFLIFRPFYPLFSKLGMLEGEYFVLPTSVGCVLGIVIYSILIAAIIVFFKFRLRNRI